MTTHVGMLLATLTPGHMGGSETYVRGLLDAFAAGQGPDRTTVLAHASALRTLDGLGGSSVAVHSLGGTGPVGGGIRRATWLAAALGSARIRPLRGLAVDVVHAPLTIPVPRIEAPLVITLHDAAHYEFPSSFPPMERAFRRLAYDEPTRRAQLVIATSEHARSGIIRHLGLAAERVVAIHHGIDHDRFTPDPDPRDAERLASFSLPRRFVVYPANLWQHKNHERLIEGLAATADDGLALVLTGRAGPRWSALRSLAARLRVGDRVRHLGYLPRDAMPALYRRATGLVFPSLFEGFGAPPLEAMACGCPVATSDAGAVVEVTGNAALHFDARDPAAIGAALDRIADDEALRRGLRALGPVHAARFTWAATARLHAEAYERARGQD